MYRNRQPRATASRLIRRRRCGCSQFARPHVETLEPRLLLTLGACVAPDCLDVELLPEFDQFGAQIETIQAYDDGVNEPHAAFAIYDTGASVVTFSAAEQLIGELLGSPIPIKVEGGAQADAVGGSLTGDVSQPATIAADGLHAITITGDFDISIDLSTAAQAPGVQAFIGDETGSPILPTITGTPINNPSPTHPGGAAALVNMTAYQIDFGALFPEIPEFKDIVVDLPDLQFTSPGVQLEAAADGSTTAPVRVPLSMWGADNHLDPGDMITTSPNPVQTQVDVFNGLAEAPDHTLLLDTGAQLTVVSTEIATQLGLDLDNPETTISVQGAAGVTDVPGYTIDAIELPRDDNGDGVVDGVLRFSNVPVYVLDVVGGLDGLLGMNLFNTASEILYDPFDPAGPSVSFTFFSNLQRELISPEEQSAINLLAGAFPALADNFNFSGIQFPSEGGWQNSLSELDVDADGFITPTDALMVINELLVVGSHQLSFPPLRDSALASFIDTDGDGAVTPSDALVVINYLLQFGAGPAPAKVAPVVVTADLTLGGSLPGDASMPKQLESPKVSLSAVVALPQQLRPASDVNVSQPQFSDEILAARARSANLPAQTRNAANHESAIRDALTASSKADDTGNESAAWEKLLTLLAEDVQQLSH